MIETAFDWITNLQPYQWVISSGLLLDVGGVVMLYRYGLPSKFPSKGNTLVDSNDSASERERSLFELKSRTGLMLLVVGFLAQIFGTLMN